MTNSTVSGPARALPRSLRGKFPDTKVPLKGSLIAALLFGLVYAGTLAVLFMPRGMIEGPSPSYVPPIMGTSIVMPSGLPDLSSPSKIAPRQSAAPTASAP